MLEFSLVPEIADFVIQYEHVGSRVTCDPIPDGGDDDWLILVPHLASVESPLYELRFKHDGSCPSDVRGYQPVFASYSQDDLNLIITDDPDFYRRFSAATRITKKLSLLRKEDRI